MYYSSLYYVRDFMSPPFPFLSFLSSTLFFFTSTFLSSVSQGRMESRSTLTDFKRLIVFFRGWRKSLSKLRSFRCRSKPETDKDIGTSVKEENWSGWIGVSLKRIQGYRWWLDNDLTEIRLYWSWMVTLVEISKDVRVTEYRFERFGRSKVFTTSKNFYKND